MQPIIYFASDHAGFVLKNELVAFVRDELGFSVVDCGADTYDEGDDFTDFIAKASREVSVNPKKTMAIILGGSGQGEAMLANRFHNVRAAVYYGGDEEIVSLSRVHNDANVLSLGARFLDTKQAKQAVSLWLTTVHTPVVKYDRRIKEIEEFSSVDVDTDDNHRLLFSLVPSLPAKSFEEISHLLNDLQGVSRGVQIDLVDGVFAPHISWPFSELDVDEEFEKLKPYANLFEIEVDCMCMNPEHYLDTFVELGVKRVIVHAESTDNYTACIAHAKKHGYKIGLAILNDTSPLLLDIYVADLDFVQVMGIKNIGVQGQVFDERTIETISKIRSKYPQFEIAVDGSVNEHTIPALLEAGANRFAPGSAISKALDPEVSYKHLARMIGL